MPNTPSSVGSRVETMDLLVFSAVARLGSFGQAAAELAIATPSVSARMVALERRLGAKLLVRGARGTTLTPAGERFATYADRCLELLDEAGLVVTDNDVERLVIAAPASLGTAVFVPALAALADVGVHVHCRIAHSGEVIARLRDGTVHAGFAFPKGSTAGVRSRRVGQSKLVAVCAPDHPLAGAPKITRTDFAELPVVVYRWGAAAQPLVELFDHPGRRPGAPVLSIGLPETAVELAATGGYIAVVPAFSARRAVDAGRLHILPYQMPSWRMDIRFFYSSATMHRTGVAALLSRLDDISRALKS
ncbi:LysR family transcriptional regulator [Nocardia sp. NPDC052566]|uniref:LysR family transcriptional regulator n=1 Tax=Nocardia sp. NPDC052566 TaxID=3364330 RepID=UPI0037C6FCC1